MRPHDAPMDARTGGGSARGAAGLRDMASGACAKGVWSGRGKKASREGAGATPSPARQVYYRLLDRVISGALCHRL